MINVSSAPVRPRRRHAIGIGAQKAASTWIHDLLRLHGDVDVPREKELDFFTARHDRGHAWYRAQFKGTGLAFECSPAYLPCPRAARRARDFDPALRVIVTLRDPVARAYSQHLHEIAKGHIPRCSFDTGMADNPSYLDQGLYAKHLTAWFDAFPREQILVLFAEEIAADPRRAARQVHRFLGLTPGPALTERRNVSDTPRLPALRMALRAGGDAMRHIGGERLLLRAKILPGVAHLLSWNSVAMRDLVPPLAPGEQRALADYFADDGRALCRMLERDSLPWTVPRQARAQLGAVSSTAPGSPHRPTDRMSASVARG